MAFSISHNKHKNEIKQVIWKANVERKKNPRALWEFLRAIALVARSVDRYVTFMKHTHTILDAHALDFFLLLSFTTK